MTGIANGGSEPALVAAAFANVSLSLLGSTAQSRYDIVATVDSLRASTSSKGEAGTL